MVLSSSLDFSKATEVFNLTKKDAIKRLQTAVRKSQGDSKRACWKPDARPLWWKQEIEIYVPIQNDVEKKVTTLEFKAQGKKNYWQLDDLRATLLLYENRDKLSNEAVGVDAEQEVGGDDMVVGSEDGDAGVGGVGDKDGGEHSANLLGIDADKESSESGSNSARLDEDDVKVAKQGKPLGKNNRRKREKSADKGVTKEGRATKKRVLRSTKDGMKAKKVKKNEVIVDGSEDDARQVEIQGVSLASDVLEGKEEVEGQTGGVDSEIGSEKHHGDGGSLDEKKIAMIAKSKTAVSEAVAASVDQNGPGPTEREATDDDDVRMVVDNPLVVSDRDENMGQMEKEGNSVGASDEQNIDDQKDKCDVSNEEIATVSRNARIEQKNNELSRRFKADLVAFRMTAARKRAAIVRELETDRDTLTQSHQLIKMNFPKEAIDTPIGEYVNKCNADSREWLLQLVEGRVIRAREGRESVGQLKAATNAYQQARREQVQRTARKATRQVTAREQAASKTPATVARARPRRTAATTAARRNQELLGGKKLAGGQTGLMNRTGKRKADGKKGREAQKNGNEDGEDKGSELGGGRKVGGGGIDGGNRGRKEVEDGQVEGMQTPEGERKAYTMAKEEFLKLLRTQRDKDRFFEECQAAYYEEVEQQR